MIQRSFLAALPALLLLACSSSQPPLRVRAADPSSFSAAVPGQPIIIEFQEGDEIPLEVSVSGDLVATDPATPPVKVRAKRHFYLRLDGSEMKTSLDGEHFGSSAKRGSFAFGLGFDQTGTKATIKVTTPTPSQ